MTRRAVATLAPASVGVAFLLGLVDYETHGLGDLISAENVPALLLFAILSFIVLSGCYLTIVAVGKGLGSVWGRLRTRATA